MFFSNHGCNDLPEGFFDEFTKPEKDNIREFMLDWERPDEPEDAEFDIKYINDAALMAAIADKLEEVINGVEELKDQIMKTGLPFGEEFIKREEWSDFPSTRTHADIGKQLRKALDQNMFRAKNVKIRVIGPNDMENIIKSLNSDNTKTIEMPGTFSVSPYDDNTCDEDDVEKVLKWLDEVNGDNDENSGN